MSTRPLLKSAGWLTLLLTALMGMIRAHPYSGAELRAFLAPPPGCPAPCFMGIRPGVTTADSLLTILRTHPWARAMTHDTSLGAVSHDGDAQIFWQWSGAQPGFIAAGEPGQIALRRSIVSSLLADTHISLGEAWLALDTSQPLRIEKWRIFRGMALGVTPLDEGFTLVAEWRCPIHDVRTFWDAPVRILFRGEFDSPQPETTLKFFRCEA
jgi:hypothetical protein